MWSYYGSKTNLGPLYPRPKYDVIIEPFAGAAKYSLLHYKKRVILFEIDPLLYDIWQYLLNTTESSIRSLPRSMQIGQSVDDLAFPFDCEGQYNLFRFIIGKASPHPKNIVSSRIAKDRPNTINYQIEKIANNLHKIKHFDIRNESYVNCPDMIGTWFIDPPYQYGGEHYRHGNRTIDYEFLRDWCTSRSGQVIVCENMKANWMDFKPLKQIRGSNASSIEALWTNDNVSLPGTPLSLFPLL